MKQALTFIVLLFSFCIQGVAQVQQHDQSHFSFITSSGVTQFSIYPKYVAVNFVEGATLDDIDGLLGSVQILKYQRPEKLEDDFYDLPVVLELKNETSAEECLELVEYLRQSAIINYANPFLISDRNEIVGYADAFLVKLNQGGGYDQLQELCTKYNSSIYTDEYLGSNVYRITIPKNKSIFDITDAFRKNEAFKYIEIDYIFISVSQSSKQHLQWSLSNNGSNYPPGYQVTGKKGADMNVVEAWSITKGNPSIKIAVLDVGVQLDHPDLDDNLLPGYDAIPLVGGGTHGGYSDTLDWHGTACAGIIAAEDNSDGITGIAPQCKIVPVRIGKKNPNINWFTILFISQSSWIKKGINWASDHADILSNSNHFVYDEFIAESIEDATNAGKIFFSAAGNYNKPSVEFPASLPNVIAVGASTMCDTRKRSSHDITKLIPSALPDPNSTSCDGEVRWGSSYGAGLDISAPGVGIVTTTIGSQYIDYFGGTSASCPNAAGVAALVLSVNPYLSASEVRNIIETTCDKIPGDPVEGYSYHIEPGQPNGTWKEDLGYGRVNAYRAVHKAAYRIMFNTPNSPISITPNNINLCSNFKITTNIKNAGPKTWKGTIYISIHKMDGDFIQDLATATNVYLPSMANTPISVTVPVSSIHQLIAGNTYKIYIKYQTDGTPFKDEYPLVELGLNPATLPINYSPACDNISIPPGDYKSIFLSGLSLNQQTNEVEFILQGIPAKSGDPIVNIKTEATKIKKMFKQALAIPESNQWIGLYVYGTPFSFLVGDALTGLNFENTDLANVLFTADRDMKFDVIPFMTGSNNTGLMFEWTKLINQNPNIQKLKAVPGLYYPGIKCRFGIASDNLNYSSKTANDIIINDAQMSMSKSLENLELHNSVNTLDSTSRNAFLNTLSIYRNLVDQRLANAITYCLPLLNTTNFKYQPIRNAYRIMAAAHWYKTLSSNQNKPFHNLINSNNLNGIQINPPYDDNYWNQQALQYIGTEQLTDYKGSNLSVNWVGGCDFTNYGLTKNQSFSNKQDSIYSYCYDSSSYYTADSSVFFYGGTLYYSSAELLGVIHHQNSSPVLGDTLQVPVTIYNLGDKNAKQFIVNLYEEYADSVGNAQLIPIAQQTINSLDSFTNTNINFSWKPLTFGSKKLKVTVNKEHFVAERKMNNNSDYDSFFVQNNIPVVKIIAPASGSALINKQIVLIGDAYDVKDGYIKDSSLVWIANSNDTLGYGSFVTLDSLPVGSYRIALTVQNSTGKFASDYINLYAYPQGYPSVTIFGPADNDSLPDNASIFFSGDANDLSDGSVCPTAQWVSNIDSVIGIGCTLVKLLSRGNHTITLSATNTSGKTATATRNITVVDGLPSLTVNTPITNSSFFQHQMINLSGVATDFRDGNISSAIKWHSDKQGYLATGQSVFVQLLPGTHKIIASVQDKAGSTDTAIVLSVIVKHTPPVPVVVKPNTNQHFSVVDTLMFIGHATDVQDGDLHGSNLKWYSNLSGFIGFGDTVITDNFRYGSHTISLKATDNDGNDSVVKVLNIYIDAGQPLVTIASPANNTSIFYKSHVNLKGNAIDLEDGAISSNNLSWFSDIDGLLGTGDSIITNTLSSGDHVVTLQAMDSDSFLGSSNIHLIVEPPHPPSISIFYPLNNMHFINGDTIMLRAKSLDYEEGNLPGSRISWSSSINGNLGSGSTIYVNTLSPGTHTISATAIDTTSLTATTSMQIIIDQRKPIAEIINPEHGIVALLGTSISLSGTGSDYEDGTLSGSSLKWYSNKDGLLGTGNTISVSSLSNGSHLIYLVVSDQQNVLDTAKTIVIIQRPNTLLVNKFAQGQDSVSTIFTTGGDTTIHFSIPANAKILSAQLSVAGDSLSVPALEYKFIKSVNQGEVRAVFTSKTGSIYCGGYGSPANYLIKLNAQGDTVWTKSYPPLNVGNSLTGITGIDEDSSGNLYAAGTFRWGSNFGCTNYNNSIAYDGFILKIDSNGNCLWVKNIYSTGGGSTGEDFARDVSVDQSGSIYVTGNYSANATSGNIGNITATIPSGSGFNGFLAKLNNNGTVIWIKQFKGIGYTVVTDSNHYIYVGGDYLGAPGNRDAFLTKYSTNGIVQWTATGGGSNTDGINDIAIDSLGNVHVTGSISGNSVTWGGNSYITYNSTSGVSDWFYAKYNTNGALLKFLPGGGSYHDASRSICLSKSNQVFLGGFVFSSDFQMGSFFTTNPIKSPMIVTTDLQGNSKGGFKLKSSGSSSNSVINSVKCDNYGDLILGGKSDYVSNTSIGAPGFVAKRNLSPSLPLYPKNAFVDILSDSTFEWSYTGYFSSIANTSDFAADLNNTSQNIISVKIHTDGPGIVKLKNLNVQCQIIDTIKPDFISISLNSQYIIRDSNISLNVKATDNMRIDAVKAQFMKNKYTLTSSGPDSFTTSFKCPEFGKWPIVLTAYDTSGLSKDTTLYVTVYSVNNDLSLAESDITIAEAAFFTGDTVSLIATIHNNSNYAISNVPIAVSANGILKQEKQVNIPAFGKKAVTLNWKAKWKEDSISIAVNKNNTLTEQVKNNNTATKQITIYDPYPPEIVEISTPQIKPVKGSNFQLKVQVKDSTGVADVKVDWQNQIVQMVYDPAKDIYECSLVAGNVGTHVAVITAVDSNGLETKSSIDITVISGLPDVKVSNSDIVFEPSIGVEGSSSIIIAKIHNTGGSDITNGRVSLFVDGNEKTYKNISIKKDSTALATFSYNIICGTHEFTVKFDPFDLIDETNDSSNNIATVLHAFCKNIPTYSISGSAVPNIISLGDSSQIKISISPLASIINVQNAWNNQSLSFDSTNGFFKCSVTPSQPGVILMSIKVNDSFGFNTSKHVTLTVLDSIPDIQVGSILPTPPPYLPDSMMIVSTKIINNSLSTITNVPVRLLIDKQTVDSVIISSIAPMDTSLYTLSWLMKPGIHTIAIDADSAGQSIYEKNKANNYKTSSIVVNDNQPPVIQDINITSPAYKGAVIHIECLVTDNDSVSSVFIHFADSSSALTLDTSANIWETDFIVPKSGNQVLQVEANDNSNLTSFASIMIQVNDTLPELEVLSKYITFEDSISGNGKLTATIKNNGGGIATNVKTIIYLDGIPIDSNVLTDFRSGQSRDAEFHVQVPFGWHTVTVKVNPNKLTSELNYSNNTASRNFFVPDLVVPGTPQLNINPQIWTSQSSFLVFWPTVMDNNGTVTYQYALNEQSWIDIGTDTVINLSPPREGANRVSVRAIDSAGNIGNPGIAHINFDTTAPNPPTIIELHCGLIWTTHESPLIEWQNPGDKGSGIQYFEVQVDKQSPINIGLSMYFHDTMNSGVHNIKVRAVDSTGLISSWSNIITVYVDLDTPASPVLFSLTHPDQNKWYRNDSVAIVITKPHDISTVTGYWYSINRDSTFHANQTNNFINSDTIITVWLTTIDSNRMRLPDGEWYVHVSAQDSVGHLSSRSSVHKVMIDKTPPTTSTLYPDTAKGCKYEFDLTAFDYYSGVANTYYRVNGGNWVNDTLVQLTKIGGNIIEFYSIDSAGNTELYDTANIYLDNNNLHLSLGNDTVVCNSMIHEAPVGYSYRWLTGDTSMHHISNITEKLALTIVDAEGCKVTSDTIEVIVNYSIDTNIEETICEGRALIFNNLVLDSIGTYRYVFQRSNGCDSFVTLILHGAQYEHKDIDTTICSTATYKFNGKTFNTTGIYSDTLKSHISCDTVWKLRLTVINCDTVSKGLANVRVYPNPFHNEVTVEINGSAEGYVEIAVCDIYGKLLKKEYLGIELGNNTYSYEFCDLAAGIYIMRLQIEGQFFIYKLTKY